MGARSFFVAGLFVAATLTSTRARATGAIVSAPAGASSASEVRIAVASTGARTSRWVSLRVHGTATPFAWVLPVKPDAFVDLSSDAWLESLEEATAPRLVPPDVAPPCEAGGVEVDGDPSHWSTTAPSAVGVAATSAALTTTLEGWGLVMTGELAPLLEQAGANGDSFVALLYPAAPQDVVTRTVRIVDSSAPTIPLSLTSGTASVAVTAYMFATGGATPGTGPMVTLDPSLLLWRADGTSTYAGVSDALLTTHPGAWLLETTGHDPLFEGAVVPGSGGVPAVTPTYFSRAWTYGDAVGAPAACAAAASALSTSLDPVARACPAGALTRVGEPNCEESPSAGELPPDALRCGGIADDLALALSGRAPGGTWLTRTRSVLAAGTFGSDEAVLPSATSAAGPVVTCSGYGAACAGGGGGGTSPAPPGTGSSGGTSGSSSSGTPDPAAVGDVGSAVGDVVGAAIDASSSDGGCGGDSSSGDSCNSDTSGDGASADDCSGGDASGSGSCAVEGTRARGRRAPTSRLLLLAVAFAAVARRRARRGRGLVCPGRERRLFF